MFVRVVLACLLTSSQRASAIPPCHVVNLDVPLHLSAGRSVAVSESTLAVGVPQYSSGGITNRGAVFVYRREGADWLFETILTAPDARPSEQMGSGGLFVDDGRIIVGVPSAFSAQFQTPSAGALYVYERETHGWTFRSKIVTGLGFPVSHSGFGSSIAICGDALVAGARRLGGTAGPFQGAVHLFIRSGGSWVHTEVLRSSDAAPTDNFGAAVAMDSDTLVVGSDQAPLGSGNPSLGAVYVFERVGDSWVETRKIIPPGPDTSFAFGSALDLDDGTLIVGSPHDSEPGQAFVYRRTGQEWQYVGNLVPGDLISAFGFGSSVAIDGDRALIGANGWNPTGTPRRGAAYVFARLGESYWTERARLLAENGDREDRFGEAVSLARGVGVVGARAFGAQSSSFPGGAAFIMSVAPEFPCAADFDRDGVVALPDLAMLINNWTSPVPDAPFTLDLDADCEVGLGDLAGVLQNWAAECP